MGRKLEIIMTENNLSVTVHYQFYDNVSVIRAWAEVTNKGKKAQGIEYISSFALTGITRKGLQDRDEKSNIYLPHNSWKGEFQWRKYGVKELGLTRVNRFSMKRIFCNSTGTLSTSEHLPMGCFENTEGLNS